MDELTELQHDSSIAEATAPPDFRAMFQSVVSESGLATSEDFSLLRGEINALSQRLVAVEETLAEVPKTYASADSVSKVKASQVEYESSRRKLTKQVADMANIQVDSKRQFGMIETRLNEVSTLKTRVDSMANALNGFTESITTFMTTQRERLDNHDARINNASSGVSGLASEVTFVKDTQSDAEKRYIQTITPMHDFINGSPTQKPLKETLSHFETTMNTLNSGQVQQSMVLKSLEDYMKAQQAKEEARRNFYQRARIQLATPRGLIAILIVVIGVIALMNAFSFDQLIARIQQLAGVVQLLLGK